MKKQYQKPQSIVIEMMQTLTPLLTSNELYRVNEYVEENEEEELGG